MAPERDFEDFYTAEYPLVFRAALAFDGRREEALDATQEAFARAFSRWRRLRNEAWAGGWVMRTAMNLCKRALRDETRTMPAEHAPASDQASEQRVDVSAALRGLPARQRQAAVLHYIGDIPVVGVAELMSISEGATKSHLARAREALRAPLEVADV